MRSSDNVSHENVTEVRAIPVQSGVQFFVAATDIIPVADLDILVNVIPVEATDPYDDEAYFTRFPPASGLPTMEFISNTGSFASRGIPTITNHRPESRGDSNKIRKHLIPH